MPIDALVDVAAGARTPAAAQPAAASPRRINRTIAAIVGVVVIAAAAAIAIVANMTHGRPSASTSNAIDGKQHEVATDPPAVNPPFFRPEYPTQSQVAVSTSPTIPAATEPPVAIATQQPPPKEPDYMAAEGNPAQSLNALRMAQEFYAHDLLPKAKEVLIQIAYADTASADTKSEALYLLGQISFDEGHFKTAMDDWTKLQANHPNSTRSKEVATRIAQLGEVVAKFSDAKLSSVVARSYIENGDFWSGAKRVFTIDSSWLPHVEMAVEWYDKVITEFPKTDAAEMAYARKLLALIGWKELGQYGEAYGVKRDFDKYMPQVLQTFAAFEKAFPESSYLQAFRFQIAQAYWTKENNEKTREWLNKIIAAGGRSESFYVALARARLQKLAHRD